MGERPIDPRDLTEFLNDLSRRLTDVERRQLGGLIEALELQTLNDGQPLGLTKFIDFAGSASAKLVGERFVRVEGGGPYTITVAASDTPDVLKGRADFVCSGSSDQEVINAALVTLRDAGVGGRVQLMNGHFSLSQKIDYDNVDTDIEIVGVGRGTVLRADATFNALIEIFGAPEGVAIRNMQLDGNGNQVTFGVQTNAPHSLYENLFIKETGNGISADGDRTIIRQCSLMDIGTTSANSAIFCTGADSLVEDVWIDTVGTTGVTHDGIVMVDVGSQVRNCQVKNVFGRGIRLNGSEQHCSDCRVYFPAQHGIDVGGSFLDTLVTLQNCKVIGAGQHGIRVFCNDGSITGNLVVDASQGTHNTSDGIFVQSADRNQIQMNKVLATGATTHRYAINISNAGAANNAVCNNDLRDSATANFNDAGTGTLPTGTNGEICCCT